MSLEKLAPSGNRPSRVRYGVLAVICVLALLTYVNRLGFGVAASSIKKDLGLDDRQMGYLASAFLVAYGLFQIPGGLLGDRFGGRHLITILVLGWSFLSGATAFGLRLPAGAASAFGFLMVLRFLFGLFQAAEFPSLARVIAIWMPVEERGSAQGIIWMFSRLGGAIVPFLFTWMLLLFDTWTTPLWVMAGLGMLWCALFWPWFRDQPGEIARVNRGELDVIAGGRVTDSAPGGPIPWRRILASVDIWPLCLMYGFVGFAGNFFTSMMPLYLRDHRHLADQEFAILSALPLGLGIGSCALGGFCSDWIIRRSGSRRWGRRIVSLVGLAVAALTMFSIPRIEGIWILGIALSLAFACTDLNIGPAWAACADIGERYTGTISGAMNMVGAFAGAAGTAFAGHFFDKNKDNLVFIVYGCSYALAVLCWLGVDVTRPQLAGPPIPLQTNNIQSLTAGPCVEV